AVLDMAWRADTLVLLTDGRLLWRNPANGRFTAGPLLGNALGRLHTIVNGTRASVGSDDAAVRARIARAVNTPATCTVSIAPLAPAESGTVSVTAEIAGDSSDAEAVAVLVEDGLVSSVKSGENAGETLRHTRVVRAVQTLATPGKQPHFTLKLPADLKPANARVVVFVQRTGLGAITAAASAPLAVPSPVAPAPAR
ncbi:MAG: DUF1223 domain-containing protein, partial [Phycisphaerales bacterium]|nr:DUF1223 domain-containing protein [Phycisphaerales bacterium]